MYDTPGYPFLLRRAFKAWKIFPGEVDNRLLFYKVFMALSSYIERQRKVRINSFLLRAKKALRLLQGSLRQWREGPRKQPIRYSELRRVQRG